MKVLDIALKDMLRSTRSMFALMFMFVMPVMITAILYFAFGGASEEEGVDLPVTHAIVANLDQSDAEFGDFSAGEMLSEFLQSDSLADLLLVDMAENEAQARQAVTDREADVAVIIPAGFTAAVIEPDGQSEVTLYQDPTLTLGPAIVEGLLGQYVDGFAGTKIATNVIFEQLGEREIELSGLALQQTIMQYATWSSDTGAGENRLLDIQPPRTVGDAGDNGTTTTRLIMTSMMIFYVFFTGAATAQTIIREEEEGTLQRLFTTPTPVETVLTGKLAASILTLGVQVGILMLASSILFGIQWGAPLSTLLVATATVLVAAGFGMFLMSLLKSSRQVGVVYGGVMTVSGMLGGLFTSGIPGVPAVFNTVSLSMPQGWALRGWKEALAGGGVTNVLLSTGVMVVIAGAFLAIGMVRFRKRFA